MKENENKDFTEAAELKNIDVHDAEELKVLEDSEEMSEEQLYSRYEEIMAKAKADGFKNKPYEKIMNVEGEIANPITKSEPYRNPFPNRSQRRAMLRDKQPKNNGNVVRTVIKKIGKTFLRYNVINQHIPANSNVPIYEELAQEQIDEGIVPAVIGHKDTTARTVQHYVLATK